MATRIAWRARRLHKSRGTIEYFGSSIANGSMAEDGTKIPRSRSPEAGVLVDQSKPPWRNMVHIQAPEHRKIVVYERAGGVRDC